MIFDIDVSGEDIFSKDYTICVANNDGIISGFKFDPKLIGDLNSKYGQGLYKYKKSKKGNALFKVRLYTIVIFKIIESLDAQKDYSFNICRDFYGKEEDIKNNLKFFFSEQLGISYEISFCRLGKDSQAHRYSYLMRKDSKNKMSTYIDIPISEFEKYLKK